MTFALVGLGGLGLALGLRLGRPCLFLLGAAILLFHALPLLLLDQGTAPATLRAHVGTATTIAGLGSVAWYAGYWLLLRAPSISAAPTVAMAPTAAKRVHILVLCILFSLIATAAGGPVGFVQSGFLRLPVGSFQFSLTYAFACLSALTTTLLCVNSAVGRSTPPWLSMGAVLLVFWVLGGRTQFAITAMSFGLVFLAHRRIRLRNLFLPAMAATVPVTLTLVFRLDLQGEETDFANAVRLTLSQLSLLESYALAARFVEEAGHRGGHYWQALQQIFPRALFSEKPLQLSRELRLMEARDSLGGLTPGLAGEAFVAAGIIGVVVIGIAFGGMLALLDNACHALPRLSPIMQVSVVSLIPLLTIFALRGGFDTAIFRLIIVALATAFGAFWRMGRAPHLPQVLS